jgi:predicted molibdopterin-dependent oxidoreductase YjgC
VNDKDRLTKRLIREGSRFREATWEEALELVATKFGQVRQANGPDSIGFIASSKCTNEEAYLMQKLARAVVGTNNVDNCSRYCQFPATMRLFRTVGYGGDSGSIKDIEQAGMVSLEPFTLEFAEEVTGISKATLERLAQMIAAADGVAICWAMGVTQHGNGSDTSTAISNLLLVTGNYMRPGAGAFPLRGHNNVQGASDMGAMPDRFPGYHHHTSSAWRRCRRPTNSRAALSRSSRPKSSLFRAH